MAAPSHPTAHTLSFDGAVLENRTKLNYDSSLLEYRRHIKSSGVALLQKRRYCFSLSFGRYRNALWYAYFSLVPFCNNALFFNWKVEPWQIRVRGARQLTVESWAINMPESNWLRLSIDDLKPCCWELRLKKLVYLAETRKFLSEIRL